MRIVFLTPLALAISLLLPPMAAANVVVTEGWKGLTLTTTDGDLRADVSLWLNDGMWDITVTGVDERPALTPVDAGAPRCVEGPGPLQVRCDMHWSELDSTEVDVVGGEGADSLTVRGSTGASLLATLGGGDDTVDVSAFASPAGVAAGAGNDAIYHCGCARASGWVDRDHVIDGGAGTDQLDFSRARAGVGDAWGNHHRIAASIESVVGSAMADVIVAPGTQRIAAGAGNDYVDGPDVSSDIDLGPGDDTFVNAGSTKASHHVLGRAGSDTYTADHRGNYFICLDQRRTVCPAHDGRKGEKDRVGDDVENVVLTGDGWDIVAGSRAANIINTGPGRDVIVGSAGADDYQGGAAFDVITYEYVSIQPRRVHLTGDGRDNDGGPRRARIRESVEGLVGSVFGDVIIGSPRSDSLYGLAGNDRITGGGGRDLVDGGLGNDSIDVRDGRGGDEVRCGKGRDTVRADAGDRVAKDCERRS